MVEISQSLYAPLGVITAAIIAALASLLGLIISKENKVSEFRQAWIDSLRKDIAEHVASVCTLAYAEKLWKTPNPNGHQPEVAWLDFFKSLQSTFVSITTTQAGIRLRINPDDSDPKLNIKNKELLTKLSEIQTAISDSEYGNAQSLAIELHSQAAPILKLEWSRVKKGEPIYKWSVRLLIFALVLLVSGAVFMFVTHKGTSLNNLENHPAKAAPSGKEASPPKPATVTPPAPKPEGQAASRS